MQTGSLRCLRYLALLIGLILLGGAPTFAQVQTDGSLGPATTLSGNMVISNALGKQVGANLFHSFSLFNIQTGDSATFTSSFSGATKNVIARVTGNSASWIDGTLASSIPGADLWLINPKGIAFGNNATLDVPGSFRASTADYLGFQDGKRFSAKMPSGPELLSVADPSAFGFLSSSPAPIYINESVLGVSSGRSIGFVGGDIAIVGGTNGFLVAPGGRIDLVSAAGIGEARLNKTGAMDVGSFSKFGTITLENDALLRVSNQNGAGGSVYIRGGRFFATESEIENITGPENGGKIDIGISGDVRIGEGTWIATYTNDSGRAGDVRINAGGDLTLSAESVIASSTKAWGSSGDVTVEARNIDIRDQGKIVTMSSQSFGNAGKISVTASDTMSISGDPVDIGSNGQVDFRTGIASTSYLSFGDAGDISVKSKNLKMSGGTINSENVFSFGKSGNVTVDVAGLDLSQGAIVAVSSLGWGHGGNLTITATDHVSASGSTIEANAFSSGPGGSIQLSTPNLNLDHSYIETASDDIGDAGNIKITSNKITLTSGVITSDAKPFSSGNAGSVSVEATGSILLKNAGSPLDRPRISSSTMGEGDAGSVTIKTPSLTLDDGGIYSNTQVVTDSAGTPLRDEDGNIYGGKGNAGTITINVNDLLLQNGGSITTGVSEIATGSGGSIDITAQNSISLIAESFAVEEAGKSAISALTMGDGNAGDVRISTPRLDLNGGIISASTGRGLGDGGNIFITAGSVSLENEGGIQVGSACPGAGGTLAIEASTISITGNVGNEYFTGITSGALGSGNGGDVRIVANRLDLMDKARITAGSSGAGKAGTLAFDISDTLQMKNSNIYTSADFAAGGNIALNVGHMLQLQNSSIESSANGVTATDNGGNMTLARPQFMVLNKSKILARANAGNGGNINLGAANFVNSSDSAINASSKQGLDGTIAIDSPNRVTGTIAVLPLPSLNISELLRERCAAAALRARSSFTIQGAGGITPRPGDFLPSPFPRLRKETSADISSGSAR